MASTRRSTRARAKSPICVTLQALKVGLDNIIESRVNPATRKLNAKALPLTAYKNRLLGKSTSINPVYREARLPIADLWKSRTPCEPGRRWSPGRPAGHRPWLQGVPAAEQQGVRIGYADKVREQLERTGNIPSILREKVPKG